ncbi:ABC transporter permease subunit [Pararhodobacter sp. CCB-MM2]|uniref:ABC transporter permease subunit n=1 Tax=Pararhodobacter sp. CCB-MM2 TaxID=1786003 RepID=UPI00082CFBE9|nr:ABC transporter permease subunit [Pararhodobacter sp. CCB-MM2]
MDRASFWRSKTIRDGVLQAAFLAALIGLVLTAVLTARANLAAQGLTSGFDFLWKSTGWEMNFTLLHSERDDPYWYFLLLGLMNTLFMGTIGLAGASVIGLVVGLMRSGRNPAARLLGTLYIELFRNLPLIVQLFFWYALANALPNPRQAIEFAGAIISSRGIYVPGLTVTSGAVALAVAALLIGAALAIWIATARRFRRMERQRQRGAALMAFGLAALVAVIALVTGHDSTQPWTTFPAVDGLRVSGGFRIQPEFYCLAIAIMTYGGAYIGEIVRGGFKAVGRGQMEASRALGLSNWQVFTQVQMPLAFRAMLPILINQYVWLIKATTLGIAVGFSDFFMVIASSINHSGQTIEFISILVGGFLFINFSLAAILNRLNRAIALKGHQTGGAA